MGLFSALVKVAVDVVTLPVAVVKDAATLGGVCTGESESYTAQKLKEIKKDSEG